MRFKQHERKRCPHKVNSCVNYLVGNPMVEKGQEYKPDSYSKLAAQSSNPQPQIYLSSNRGEICPC